MNNRKNPPVHSADIVFPPDMNAHEADISLLLHQAATKGAIPADLDHKILEMAAEAVAPSPHAVLPSFSAQSSDLSSEEVPQQPFSPGMDATKKTRHLHMSRQWPNVLAAAAVLVLAVTVVPLFSGSEGDSGDLRSKAGNVEPDVLPSGLKISELTQDAENLFKKPATLPPGLTSASRESDGQSSNSPPEPGVTSISGVASVAPSDNTSVSESVSVVTLSSTVTTKPTSPPGAEVNPLDTEMAASAPLVTASAALSSATSPLLNHSSQLSHSLGPSLSKETKGISVDGLSIDKERLMESAAKNPGNANAGPVLTPELAPVTSTVDRPEVTRHAGSTVVEGAKVVLAELVSSTPTDPQAISDVESEAKQGIVAPDLVESVVGSEQIKSHSLPHSEGQSIQQLIQIETEKTEYLKEKPLRRTLIVSSASSQSPPVEGGQRGVINSEVQKFNLKADQLTPARPPPRTDYVTRLPDSDPGGTVTGLENTKVSAEVQTRAHSAKSDAIEQNTDSLARAPADNEQIAAKNLVNSAGYLYRTSAERWKAEILKLIKQKRVKEAKNEYTLFRSLHPYHKIRSTLPWDVSK